MSKCNEIHYFNNIVYTNFEGGELVNRISTKITICFYIVVFFIEIILMFYLYQNILHTRLQEEFDRLMANGKNYRDVLVENYSQLTIHHIVMMEKNENRNVIITDKDGNIIDHSEHIKLLEDKLSIVNNQKIDMDKIIINEWKDSPYIASAHPYDIDENTNGYVVMFQSTKDLLQMVKGMNLHFAIAGVTSLIVLLIVYAILSKIITKPFIRIKDAQITDGD